MLDFIGTVVTAALMMLIVNALITFMDTSRAAKITLAAVIGVWIGLAAAAAGAGGVAISRPVPVVGFFVAVPLLLVPIWLILHAIIAVRLRRAKLGQAAIVVA